jgi:endonuclease YncB( thermonuclease family)
MTASSTVPTVPLGEPAQLRRVFDGDSFEAETGGEVVEVRMIGINAPEGDECHGDEARDALERRLTSGPLTLVAAGEDDTDRFGRLLRYVYAGGTNVNEASLREGHAVALESEHPADLDFFALAEAAASQGLGMWAPNACGEPVGASIRIGEVAYDPAGPDDENVREELVVLHNDGTVAVTLEGWILRDESSQNRYVFAEVRLDPGDEVRVRSGCGNDTDADLFWCARDPVWSNWGDTVILQDPAGNVVDYRGWRR